MGAKIKRGAGLDLRLEKTAEKSTRALRNVTRDGAYELAETARQMAPVLSGDLEGSIQVTETIESGNRKDFTVGTEGVPYAIFMHEQIYELGPASQAKDNTSPHRVGRKYMERAVSWLIRDWGFYQKARAAVRKGNK